MQSRFSKITREMQKLLPRWFKMRKDVNSVGAQFLNIFGLQYEDIEFYLQYAFDNQYIDTVDVNQVDIIYKASLPSSLTYESKIDLFGEGMKMDGAGSLREFLMGLNPKFLAHKELYYPNPFYIDWDRKLVYVKRAYRVSDTNPEGEIMLVVYQGETKLFETTVPTMVHHVWNFFDEFGLLLDTPRLYGEKNLGYKERLLDVFRHPANSTRRGMINSLARELGLYRKEHWHDAALDFTIKQANVIVETIEVDGKVWDSARTEYDRSDRLVLKGDLALLGKARTVQYVAGLQLHTFHNRTDYAFQNELYSVDRLATPMLQYYVDLITNEVPIMWEQFIWNESFWDIADVNMSGYGYIPSYNDARFLNWSKYKD